MGHVEQRRREVVRVVRPYHVLVQPTLLHLALHQHIVLLLVLLLAAIQLVRARAVNRQLHEGREVEVHGVGSAAMDTLRGLDRHR